ncbi:hypothetical protein D3C83_252690 [compost metagenome]
MPENPVTTASPGATMPGMAKGACARAVPAEAPKITKPAVRPAATRRQIWRIESLNRRNMAISLAIALGGTKFS